MDGEGVGKFVGVRPDAEIGIVGIVFFAGLVAQIHPSLLVCICVSGVIQYYYGERLAEFKEKTVKETRGLRTKTVSYTHLDVYKRQSAFRLTSPFRRIKRAVLA